MSKNSKIEWCDHTANWWWGCQKVSDGCKNCYADTWAKRYGKQIWGPPQTTDREYKKGVWKDVVKWNKQSKADGVRRRVFTMSMGDFFEDHPQVVEWRNEAMLLMAELDALDWLVLTKRPENVLGMVPDAWLDTWPAHVWVGTSVENQEQADKRIPELLNIPAAVRFLSMEPLLGAVDLTEIKQIGDCLYKCRVCFGSGTFPEKGDPDFTLGQVCPECSGIQGIDWVIVGGESGHGVRPMHPDWVRSLRDQCQKAGVPFFFKQWGEWLPVDDAIKAGLINTYTDTHKIKNFDGTYFAKVGKKLSGRMLDGREWSEFPAQTTLTPAANKV